MSMKKIESKIAKNQLHPPIFTTTMNFLLFLSPPWPSAATTLTTISTISRHLTTLCGGYTTSLSPLQILFLPPPATHHQFNHHSLSISGRPPGLLATNTTLGCFSPGPLSFFFFFSPLSLNSGHEL